MLWTQPDSPRIWRGNSLGQALPGAYPEANRYTDEVLARVAAEGFNGVWLFTLLHDLKKATLFPELNSPLADARVADIQALIERAARHGIGVYLYFNEPVSLPVDHEFWKTHPDLRGVTKWNTYALCTSTPEVMAWFRDAVDSLFARLHGVAGVFLITACESLTHCWSKSAVRNGAPPPTCPRCAGREPGDLVLDMIQVWADVRRRQAKPFRLMAWNWEWAYYYPDPQSYIVDRLPEGVELLLDIEIGGRRQWRGREQAITEYSLAYTGPSERFLATRNAVEKRGVPVHAKIQINSTHEMCTVPNLPVLRTLHGKFAGLVENNVAGFLGCWSIGNGFTVNTYAMKLFKRDPRRFMDAQAFLEQLAEEYLGTTDPALVARAWTGFSDAFALYPFCIPMLYSGPHNDAPGRPLLLRYQGKPTTRSFMMDEPGDDFAGCMHGYTLDEAIDAFAQMRDGWVVALADYVPALEREDAGLSPEQRRRRREELSSARMAGLQIASIVNVLRFYREQMRVIKAAELTPPCDLPRDPALLAIMGEEVANARLALPLVEADKRLGFHEECGGYKYDAAKIRAKIAAMEAVLEG